MSIVPNEEYPISVAELTRFTRLDRERATLTALRHARIAGEMGLPATDYKVFDLVGLAERPLTAGRIAELTGLTTGAVTGVLDRLEKAGLVHRARDPEDRRRVLVVSDRTDRFASSSEAGTLQAMLALFSPAERKVLERYQCLVLEQLRAEIAGVTRGSLGR